MRIERFRQSNQVLHQINVLGIVIECKKYAWKEGGIFPCRCVLQQEVLLIDIALFAQ